MITSEQIDAWLSSPGETQHLEFKEAKRQFDSTKLHRYCVALANEGGGHLVLGVTDQVPRKVVGTVAFGNSIDLASRLFRALDFRIDIEEVDHPSGRVVVFKIPSRPIGTAYAYEGAYLMRIGEELHPMSEDRLRKIFAEGGPDWLSSPAQGNLSGQDVVQLLDTQSFFDLLKSPYPTDQNGVLDKLESEQLITQEHDRYVVSNLGAVLLAKDLSNFDTVFRKAARLIVYKGISKLDTESDFTSKQGYAVGFQALISHLMNQLPQNEVIEDALRQESKLLPEVVIRELVANALIHQDFSESGTSPVIEIYRDRIEISNPGEPIVPIERFIDGYQSRNERLADLMRRFGICEEKSSGVDRVISTSETHQLPAPDFQVGIRRTFVVIYGPKSFRKMDRNDRVRACYQHCALQWVLRRHMTNQTLRERFGLAERSSAAVSQVITAAIEDGSIKPDPGVSSSRKFARYIPIWA